MTSHLPAFVRPAERRISQILLLALLVLFSLGGGLVGRHRLSARAEIHRALLAQEDRELAELGARIRQINREIVRQEAATTASGTSEEVRVTESRKLQMEMLLQWADMHNPGGRPGPKVGVRLNLLDEAVKRGDVIAPAFLISPEGILPPAFGELFGLDAAVIGRLQESILALKERAEQAIISNTTVVAQGNGRVTLKVNVVPDAGAWQDEFRGLLHQTVGEEGARALTLLNQRSGGGLEAILQNFGTNARTITPTQERDADGRQGDLTFTIQTIPGGVSSGTIAAGGDRSKVLRSRLGAVAGLVPKEF